MKRRFHHWEVLIVPWCLVLGAAVWAAEGRIPISGPTTINQSGMYIVTKDITADASTCDGIVVDTNNVTIDFDGHSLTLLGGAGCDGVSNTPGTTDISVMNGQISGGDNGIFFQTVGGDFSVENMTIIGVTGAGITIDGSSGGPGTPCQGTQNNARAKVVENTVKAGITGSAFAGIYLHCVEGSRIERNQVRESYNGIWMDEVWDTKVTENVATQNAFAGIEIDTSFRNIVMHNVTTSNTYDGIYLYYSDNNTVMYNNASGNDANGIVVETSNFNNLTYNTASDNKSSNGEGTGILLINGSAGNTLDWNQCASNDGYGIHFDSSTFDNVYSFNRAKGCLSGPFQDDTCGQTCQNDAMDSWPSNRG